VRLTAHAGFGGRLHGLAVQPTLRVLRHGAMKDLFGGVRAPSTLGSFLRSFTWGNVRQLDAAARRLLAGLASAAPLLPGADVLAFIDMDSMQKRVYGHKKQGAGFGHTKIQAAPRGALSYPRCSREKLGGRFLGLMAYLDPKGEGNNSMPEKQRSCSGMERCVAGPARYG
jgi:hypothetical protein